MTCCKFIGNSPPGGGDPGGGGGDGSLFGDPWESLAGDEVFSENWPTFPGAGWSVHNNFDQTTSPTVDSNVSVFRAISANPAVSAAIRPGGIIVMPENLTSGRITIIRDISSALSSPGGDWCIMARAHIPQYRVVDNNSIELRMGFSLPASNNVHYNAAELIMIEQDPAITGIQCQRYDNDVVGNITEFNQSVIPSFPNGIWVFMYHQNGSSDIICFFSIDGGRTLCEVGTITKNPSTFTHLFFTFNTIKQMVTNPQIELSYIRVYDSLKQR